MAKFSTTQDEILIEELQKYSALYDYESENYKNYLVKENCWKKIAFSVKKDVDDCKKRWKSMKDTYFRHKRKLGTGSSASDKPVKWNLHERLSFLDKVKHERNSKHTLDFDDSQMTEMENEHVESNEFTFDFHDTDPDEISNLSASRELESAKANKSYVQESDTTSTTTASRCSSAASSTAVSRPNMKRCRSSDKDVFLKRFEERAQKRTEILQALHDQKKEPAPELDEVDLFMKSISLSVKKLPKHLINEAKLGILTLVTNFEARAMSSNTHQANQFNLSANNSLGNYFQSYNPQPQQPSTQIPNSQLPPNIDDITLQQL